MRTTPDGRAHGRDDGRHLRQRRLLEVLGVGHGHFRAANTRRRRVELVERALGDSSDNLSREAAAAPAFVDDDGATRFAHRLEHGVDVERPQAPKVDDLGIDAVPGELFRRRQRLRETPAVRDQRHIGAVSAHGRAIDVHAGDSRVELPFDVVEQHVLEDQHGVGIGQGRGEHPARVVERRRRDDAQSRHVRVPVLEAVRVLRGELPAGAGRHANHDGH